MKVLLTNDDGITAPGIAALEEAVAAFATVWVVAPDRGYSGCGHQVTNHSPLSVTEISERHFRVNGTPADCARLGVVEIVPDVDWVLSGVNAGGNLGADIWMSGTVAATREATWLGKRSIALSQYIRSDRPRDWAKTAAMARRVIRELIERDCPSSHYWNVNFPDVDTPVEQIKIVDVFPEPKHLEVGYVKTHEGYAFQGDYRNRPRTAGSDVSVCFDDGDIAVACVSAIAMARVENDRS
ncbi:MAG: 5'/3'-nucleotidase SurE [Planctomycetota bacterium]